MAALGSVAWPPAPLHTARLVLRESGAGDRKEFVELFSCEDVHTYLGGPQPRAELERRMPEIPGRRPGVFVVALDGAMIGTVSVDRRDAERPGHLAAGAVAGRRDAGPDVPAAAEEVEIGYMFLPQAWGHGYAAEACAAVLGWCAGALPGEPVVLCTQTANERSMRLAATLGFTEVERFEEFGAEQWFGVRHAP